MADLNHMNSGGNTIDTLGYTLRDYIEAEDDDRDVLQLRNQISQLKEVCTICIR